MGNPLDYLKDALGKEMDVVILKAKISFLLLQAKIMIEAAEGLTDDEKTKANCQAALTALGNGP